METETPYCYFHRKVVSGLFGNPNEYTFAVDDDGLRCAYSNPCDFVVVAERNFWNVGRL